jgi:tetratricopeptide (TPR) repeat protein
MMLARLKIVQHFPAGAYRSGLIAVENGVEWVVPGEAAVGQSSPAEQRLRLARILRGMGRFDAALEQAEMALAQDPASRPAKVLKFWLLTKTGRFDTAEALVDEVARIDPCEPYVFELLGGRMKGAADAERLLAHCDAALDINSAAANPTYFKALALAKLERGESARDLVSPWRHVDVVDAEAPPAWLRTLAEEIRSHPRLEPDPAGKSLREGRQTGPLNPDDGPAIAALMQLIREQVDRYVSALDEDASGFARGRPARASLTVWGVVCGPDGRQRSHRHPNGWLSGVYYVAAPADDQGAFQGPLLVGDAGEGVEAPWETRRVEPRPGRLVIFPSYMPHSTCPSKADGERISIAFDVEPA